MPINHAIWKIASDPTQLLRSSLDNEQQLEEMIVREPRILSNEWMLIGRQEPTSFGGRVDLLAIAPDASLVLVELKRNRTPREIVAQSLDYASWVERLTPERVQQVYQRFSNGKSLDKAFETRFGVELDEEALNQSHQIVILAAELDESTERIVAYLDARDIPINVLFFQVFQYGSERLLSRAWFIDPGETQANVASAKSGEAKEPWNGEYYASFGGASRSWKDAREYGFISAGGGRWYTQTLGLLSPGDRVWVKIPKVGYVGVGRVVEEVQPISELRIQAGNGERSAMDVLEFGDVYRERASDPESAEYFVRIQWLDTVPETKAVSEVGLFGNQNTVCQPTTPKWRHTVDRLKTFFPKWER